MTPKEKLLSLAREMHEAEIALMEAKNSDYTSGSADPYANFRASMIIGIEPELGILLRILDKLKRIESFVRQGTLNVKSESVRDTISDARNYLTLLQGYIEEQCCDDNS